MDVPGKEVVMAANAITVVGNLTAEPELKETPNKKTVLTFRIGVNEAGGQKGDDGFFTCTAWNSLAENLAASLRKGTRVVVTGEIRQRSFEQNGHQRSAIEILVNDAGPSLLWATAQVTKTQSERKSEAAAAVQEAEPVPVGA
jgi:single-strand DNA-binding protein